jgi:hypothetical protein
VLASVFWPLASLIAAPHCGAAENRAVEEEKWSACTPQVLKAPVAIELKRDSLQPLASPVASGSRVSASKAELGEKIARSLAGRIRGVLRSGALSTVLIDGRCVSVGRELTPSLGTASDATAPRIRLKSVNDDRLVFLVRQGAADGEEIIEVSVMLDPILHAR